MEKIKYVEYYPQKQNSKSHYHSRRNNYAFWLNDNEDDEVIKDSIFIAVNSFLKRPSGKYDAFNTIFNMVNNKLYQFQKPEYKRYFDGCFVFLSGKNVLCLPFGNKMVIHLVNGKLNNIFYDNTEFTIGFYPVYKLPNNNVIELKNTKHTFVLSDKALLNEISKEQIEAICRLDNIKEITDEFKTRIKERMFPFSIVVLPKKCGILENIKHNIRRR